MKKLIILLSIILAVGAVSIFMLDNYADMQKKLPTSFEELKNDDDALSGDEDTQASDLSLTDQPAVKFSHKGTFYSETIEVELSCDDENAVIYYTINGNDPDTDDKKYTAPIKISAKSEVTATTIKALAVTDGKKSDTVVKSFITGRNVNERFTDDTLIFVLSSDEYNLYDYYYGIAVEGYLRDKYMNEEYSGGEVKPTDPANFNIRGRESERPMYVEVYNNKGDQLISQAAGARVVGGYSRANEQKSWRLIARKEYSPETGKFRYPFFRDARDAYGGLLTRYDRITLRDGGNDREFAGLRDELTITLAKKAGFSDVQNVRPAAVFLNSKYYGFSWLHEAFSNDYLAGKYGGNADNYRILGAKELEMESDDPEDEKIMKDWNRVLELAAGDLTVQKNFDEFCSLVDIENLMLYYAIQIYIDNKDWPGNNFKVWKYYPSEDEQVTSPYLDGRFRFLMFDAEFAWGLYGAGYHDDTLSAVLWGPHMQGQSTVLMGILKRTDMRDRFMATMCELMSGAFSADSVKEALEALEKMSDPEQMYALKNGFISSWANEWSFADSRKQITEFGENRERIMIRCLKKIYEISGDLYNVNIRVPSGGDVKLGTQTVKSGDTYSVDYFKECNAELKALPYDGYAFDHWEINGKTFSEGTVRISSQMAEDGNVRIILYLKKTEKAGNVTISEIYTAGEGDWIEIYNPTSAAVNLKGYYLSDKASLPEKYKLPDIVVPEGGVVTIVCKNNKEQSALMRHQTNFSLKTGETLYFRDPDLNIISQVPILEISPDESLSLGPDGLYYIGIVTEGEYME